MIYIYDLDGTVIDSRHRYKLLGNGRIDLDYWNACSTPEKIARDGLLPLHRHYRNAINNPGDRVIIATARVLRAPDYEFIRNNLGMPDAIISRPSGYTGSGAMMKARGIARIIGNTHAMFFDDNEANVHEVARECHNVIVEFIPSDQGH